MFNTFYEVQSGYSLIAVAENQIRMMLDHGYDPVVLVQEGVRYDNGGFEPFEQQEPPSIWNEKTTDLRPVLPAFTLTDDVHPEFEQRVESVLEALRAHLADVDVCI